MLRSLTMLSVARCVTVRAPKYRNGASGGYMTLDQFSPSQAVVGESFSMNGTIVQEDSMVSRRQLAASTVRRAQSRPGSPGQVLFPLIRAFSHAEILARVAVASWLTTDHAGSPWFLQLGCTKFFFLYIKRLCRIRAS